MSKTITKERFKEISKQIAERNAQEIVDFMGDEEFIVRLIRFTAKENKLIIGLTKDGKFSIVLRMDNNIPSISFAYKLSDMGGTYRRGTSDDLLTQFALNHLYKENETPDLINDGNVFVTIANVTEFDRDNYRSAITLWFDITDKDTLMDILNDKDWMSEDSIAVTGEILNKMRNINNH